MSDEAIGVIISGIIAFLLVLSIVIGWPI